MVLISYLKSGIRGVCPNYNKANIFVTRFKMRDNCSSYNANFIEDNGDNWFFFINN